MYYIKWKHFSKNLSLKGELYNMANEVVTPEVVDSIEVVTDSVKERTLVKPAKTDAKVLDRTLHQIASNIKSEINRGLRKARKTTSLNANDLANFMKTNIANTPEVEVTLVPKEIEDPNKVKMEVAKP